MLNESKAYSGFAVDDIPAAKKFYTDVLGLTVSERNDMLLLHLPHGAEILIYPKPHHTPASYTILNFPVSDIDQAVDQLNAKGVTFERYDGIDADEKGIARNSGGPAIAWFRDPAGNILSVLQD